MAYDAWSFGVLPLLGKLVANDEDSYRYLAESIRKHPAQEELAGMMDAAGFADVRFRNLNGGIVAIHRGTRPSEAAVTPRPRAAEAALAG